MTAAAVATREHPIIFSAPSVRAILDGRKTQTRRVIRQREKDHGVWVEYSPDLGYSPASIAAQYRCPYGALGDRLWVRESWFPDTPIDGWSGDIEWMGCGRPASGVPKRYRSPEHCLYGATWSGVSLKWRPSIFMPRWASRITLQVVGLGVERLQGISWFDIRAEGTSCPEHDFPGGTCINECPSLREAFRRSWNAINGERGYRWRTNPWVWVVHFRMVTP